MSNFSVEIFIFNFFSIDLMFSQSTLISQEVFPDNQVSLENTANLNSSL